MVNKDLPQKFILLDQIRDYCIIHDDNGRNAYLESEFEGASVFETILENLLLEKKITQEEYDDFMIKYESYARCEVCIHYIKGKKHACKKWAEKPDELCEYYKRIRNA